MSDYKLLPCPFCGGKAEITFAPYAKTVYIQCTKCPAMMGRYNKTTISGHEKFKVSFEDETAVTESWNRRRAGNDGR